MLKRRNMIILILLFSSLPFIGSDCEKIILGENSGEISGSWRLVYNSGVLHDICPGETVYLPSNTGGVAVLQCPQQDSILRDYTISNNILRYTQTGIEYSIVSVNSTTLQLEGTGSSAGRYLNYSRMTADNVYRETAATRLRRVKNSSE